MKIIDLFCGCGGWDHAARNLGHQPIGIDNDKDAIISAHNAGGTVILADITTLNPKNFGKIDGLLASPPCTDFSNAGKKAGINGNTGQLMWEIPRWVEQTKPTWIACEQVPPAIKWFQHFETILQPLGYNTWTGILNAADYGVPQIRKRAILLAHLTQPITPPPPTHTQNPKNTLLDTHLQPWKTMAEALQWENPNKLVGFPRKHDGRGQPITINNQQYRSRDLKPANEPSFSLTEKTRSWKIIDPPQDTNELVVNTGRDWKKGGTRADAQKIPVTQPAPTLTGRSGRQWIIHNQSGTPIDTTWPTQRPSTTIAGRALIPHPGTNKNRYNNATKTRNDGFKILPQDALILQTFPENYPIHGNKTSQFRQIGNAIPPQLAQHLIQHLTNNT
jgi:DNA (cytosine-5)-methyltransferase 1